VLKESKYLLLRPVKSKRGKFVTSMQNCYYQKF